MLNNKEKYTFTCQVSGQDDKAYTIMSGVFTFFKFYPWGSRFQSNRRLRGVGIASHHSHFHVLGKLRIETVDRVIDLCRC